jgi:hypothetical protein
MQSGVVAHAFIQDGAESLAASNEAAAYIIFQTDGKVIEISSSMSVSSFVRTTTVSPDLTLTDTSASDTKRPWGELSLW